ncbi:hypothetical protein H0H93_010962 [Arthromyces matolae]|nr:hypothetical protein H0H93_010962 [Arthromyces matolae]
MSDSRNYTPVMFAKDIQSSGYRLPVLAQRFLRRARTLRLGPNEPGQQNERLNHGVNWLVASMAYVLRSRIDDDAFMNLTRVLVADKSLTAIMDTVQEGLFIPDDWISMFGLLTRALSPSLFSPKRRKTSHGDGDENVPSRGGQCEVSVPALNIMPATPDSASISSASEEISQETRSLDPSFALKGTVWRVSTSSPLAQESPSLFLDDSASFSDSSLTSISSCTPPKVSPPPPSKPKPKTGVIVKVVPVKKVLAPANGSLTPLKRPKAAFKPVSSRPSGHVSPRDKVPRNSDVPLVSKKTATSSKSASCQPHASTKSTSSTMPAQSRKSPSPIKFAPSRKSSVFTQPPSPSKSSRSKSSLSPPSVPKKSVSFANHLTPTKCASRRPSIPSSKSAPIVPKASVPNSLNLQRRLIILSPPPKATKGTRQDHRA